MSATLEAQVSALFAARDPRWEAGMMAAHRALAARLPHATKRAIWGEKARGYVVPITARQARDLRGQA